MKKYMYVMMLLSVMVSYAYGQKSLILDGTFQNTKTPNKMWRLNQFWTGHIWVHGKSKDNKAIEKLASRTIKDGVVTIKTPMEVKTFLDAEFKPMLSNKIGQTFQVNPSDKPQTLTYKMKIKGFLENTSSWKGVFVISDFYKKDANGKRIKNGKMSMKKIVLSKDEFKEISVDAIIPAGTSSVNVYVSMYGIGEIQVSDISATIAK